MPVTVGAVATICSGGARFALRVRLAIACGVITATGYAAVYALLDYVPAFGGSAATATEIFKGISSNALWSVFVFTLLATVSAMVTEINLPASKIAKVVDSADQPEAAVCCESASPARA